MATSIDDLIARLHAVEAELEAEFAKRREEIGFAIERHRIRFPPDVVGLQRLHKVGLWRYVRQGRWAVLFTAPIVYAGIVPFMLLDLFVSVYQRVCFPVYGIPRVRRSDYLVFDRADLPYLNALEKLNCAYCSYGNGVAAYFREVAARTEQYWCPIKHARRILAAHEGYPRYFEFGDARAYREGLERLRKQYAQPGASAVSPPPDARTPP